MKNSKTHVLDIHMYKFNEIMGLFDLTENMTIEDLNKAKKKVLMMHPDKSRLPPEYFLFYKKAFDIVVNYYKNVEKIETSKREIHREKIYQPHENSLYDRNTNQKITSTIEKMDTKVFSRKFNELFEKNIGAYTASEMENKRAKNEWFYKEEPLYQIDSGDGKRPNINYEIETMKKHQQQMGLIKYGGVKELYSAGGTRLYEDDEDDEDAPDIYVSSDPFSKLKYDDLRKVHKDQTVFAVSEKDYDSIPKYNGVDQYSAARSMDINPIEKQEAERILRERDMAMKNKLSQKHYEATLQNEKYVRMNKDILSSFLHITK
jgi:hypothetical protein